MLACDVFMQSLPAGQYVWRNKFKTGWLLAGRMSFGGSLIRPEATGYGLVFFVENMLQAKGDSLKVRHSAAHRGILANLLAPTHDFSCTNS